jgi:hypothetical protein
MKLLGEVVLLAKMALASPAYGQYAWESGFAEITAPQAEQASGPFKAAYYTDPGLPKHTIYAPMSATDGVKLPVLVWGNGGCRYFSSNVVQLALSPLMLTSLLL